MKCLVVILSLLVVAEASTQRPFNMRKCREKEAALKRCIIAGFELTQVECAVEDIVPEEFKKNKCAKVEKGMAEYCIAKGYTMTCFEMPITAAPTKAPEPVIECAKEAGYHGEQAVTVSGLTCQEWASQEPHTHNLLTAYPDADLVSNYCRNPDGDATGAWCYTTSDTRWETCGIAACAPEPVIECAKEAGYHGEQAVTVSGLTCQEWASQEPHTHTRTPERYPDADLVSNYCRNPDGDTAGGAWCYTTSDTRWETCGIAACAPEPVIECAKEDGYHGEQAVTVSGLTCQEWTSQEPHTHNRTPEGYPDADLVSNYCRNPDGYAIGAWCYTTSDRRWETCGIPAC